MNLFLIPNVCLYKLLKYAGVNRSSWYYFNLAKHADKRLQNKSRIPPGSTINRDGKIIKDAEVITALKQCRDQDKFCNGGGYIKLTHHLKRECGLYINKKKIYRLCKENNLLLQRRKKLQRPWKSVNKNHIIQEPNKL